MIERLLNPWLSSWCVMAIFMALLWLRQNRTQNANAVDAGWALGFLLCSAVAVGVLNTVSWRTWLVMALIGLWSMRLGWYLFRTRVLSGREEDGRYRRLREHSGWGALAFFAMYQFQAFLVTVLMIPVLIAMTLSESALRGFDVVAVLLWVAAVFGESLADRQLHRFLSNPANRGKTCQVGLWRYSRHPNYFFEWLHWWTYVLLAVGSPWFVWALVGPLVMGWFLLKFTGVPATERQAVRSRPDYADYQARTSVFVPWPPRRL